MEFVMNNKVHSATTKVLSFITNYGRELWIKVDIKRKGKVEKATEFTERMRKVQDKAGVVLRRVQEEIKNLVFKKRLVKSW